MTPTEPVPQLNAEALRTLATPPTPCPQCEAARYTGWESVSAPLNRPDFDPVGTLRDPAVDEPTVDEWHPQGTHYWDANAPVATAFFPYNRCDVWRCVHCSACFVQYVEAGGYYVDTRVRAINPLLIV
jgi:hypothetical protein